MSIAIIGIVISIISLAMSATTLWLTALRRGRLAMTTPSIVFFGFDEIPRPTPKVFLRTLLYSTATNGQIVEAMYVTVRHQRGGERTFSFWGYDEGSKLVAGSGLYVSRSGVAANHHFVQSAHEMPYQFEEGGYRVEVFAKLAGHRPLRLSTVQIEVSHANAHYLSKGSGILFERLADSSGYVGHVNSDRELPKPIPHG